VTACALTARTFDIVALVKPRIMVMSLLTAAGAMSLAPGTMQLATSLWLLSGTALIVGSANTLNMWLERDVDCLMTRMKNRPLPQHRLEPATALVFGAFQGVVALPLLALAGVIPAALGLLALILYVGAYTPMKPRVRGARSWRFSSSRLQSASRPHYSASRDCRISSLRSRLASWYSSRRLPETARQSGRATCF
jgi:heme O synthase-like polyprenyltransferase